MPNVILPNLGLELPDIGSDQDTWGDILNSDLTLLDLAVQYDVTSKTLTNADVTLTSVEAASSVINLTGTLTANVSLNIPAMPARVYLVRNATTGAFSVTVKTPAGAGVSVAQGTNTILFSDGTNIVQGFTSVNGTLSATSLAFSNTLLSGAGTSALPSITRLGDTDTGFWFGAPNTINVSTSGLERVQVTPTGDLEANNSVTGYWRVPSGTTAQRPVSVLDGMVRYNNEILQFEGYKNGSWGTIGGGATGGGADQVFSLNDQSVTVSYTVPTGKNAVSAGPITINNGVTVTVSDGSNWVVV